MLYEMCVTFFEFRISSIFFRAPSYVFRVSRYLFRVSSNFFRVSSFFFSFEFRVMFFEFRVTFFLLVLRYGLLMQTQKKIYSNSNLKTFMVLTYPAEEEKEKSYKSVTLRDVVLGFIEKSKWCANYVEKI